MNRKTLQHPTIVSVRRSSQLLTEFKDDLFCEYNRPATRLLCRSRTVPARRDRECDAASGFFFVSSGPPVCVHPLTRTLTHETKKIFFGDFSNISREYVPYLKISREPSRHHIFLECTVIKTKYMCIFFIFFIAIGISS